MKPRARRVSSLDEAAALADRLRAGGGTVVFTVGVFDLLHAGHVRYLREARALGDALVVGVNSDKSVRAHKGPDRPINPQHERAELVLALEPVDAAVIVDGDTPLAIVSLIQPNILVIGSDWNLDEHVARAMVEPRGGRVVRIEGAPGFSTTRLIEKVRRLP